MPPRRRAAPAPAASRATFALDPEGPWHACRVLNVSLEGAALELARGVDEPAARLIHVQFDPAAQSSGAVVLLAEVRNSSATPEARRRIGVRFVSPGSAERRFLAELIQRNGRLDEDEVHPGQRYAI